ncbi:MAG: DUF3280 domain-containing protein [Rhodomicrobium sp.]|nr:DUF3280 domain-containing protein [Rhodomicrobium sp.]
MSGKQNGLILLVIAILCLIVFNSRPGDAAPVRKAAVFDFELIDTSLEGEKRGVDPAETARLKTISDLLRDLLAKSGRYDIVPTAPAAEAIRDAGYIHSCNGCDASIAKELGADIAITGHVQKISTLILNITIVIRDAAAGTHLRSVNADIRGNTDGSWAHGVRWLVRNRLLKDQGG